MEASVHATTRSSSPCSARSPPCSPRPRTPSTTPSTCRTRTADQSALRAAVGAGFAACGARRRRQPLPHAGRRHRHCRAQPRHPGLERRRLHLHAAGRHDHRRRHRHARVGATPTPASTPACCTAPRAPGRRRRCPTSVAVRGRRVGRHPGRRRAGRAVALRTHRRCRPAASTTSTENTLQVQRAAGGAARRGGADADGAGRRSRSATASGTAAASAAALDASRRRPRRLRRSGSTSTAAASRAGARRAGAAAAAARVRRRPLHRHAPAPRRLPDGRVPRRPTAPSPAATPRPWWRARSASTTRRRRSPAAVPADTPDRRPEVVVRVGRRAQRPDRGLGDRRRRRRWR